MRQWDTKKEFKPRYDLVAELVFLSWWRMLSKHQWGYAVEALWLGLRAIMIPITGLVFSVVLLAGSPVIFPVFCLLERLLLRKRRLMYLRENRAADADI